MFKVASLFAGVGGFEVGLSKSGFHPALFCEIEPAAQAVLRARFPGVPVASDVIRLESLPDEVNVLTGGFPCQDVSTSGPKLGMDGERTVLVREILRLLALRPVEWVILENVPGVLSLAKGAVVKEVVEGLEALGYKWAYRIVDALSFGLPQKRRRVFFVASLSGDPRDVLLVDDAGELPKVPLRTDRPLGFYWTEGRHSSGLTQNAVPTLKAGSAWGIPSPPAIMLPNGFMGTPDIRDMERLQGFEADWTVAGEGLAKGARWRMVGNAVSTKASEWIGSRIVSPGSYESGKDVRMKEDAKWPAAAWNVGSGRFVAKASEYPAHPDELDIAGFLRYPLKPLSHRAANGFTTRVEESKLRYPEGFAIAARAYVDALEKKQAA